MENFFKSILKSSTILIPEKWLVSKSLIIIKTKRFSITNYIKIINDTKKGIEIPNKNKYFLKINYTFRKFDRAHNFLLWKDQTLVKTNLLRKLPELG